ncbi:MAG: hypothetical protein WA916_06055 [Arcobacter sp.]|uniref:hypothetical protein n=1 Tax=Arcobacter sp. TaxID=1872629 RepID=UPI003C70FF3F
MSKEIKLTEHGNYLFGTLDGVDFVARGVMEGKPYPASVKLKFITRITRTKTVNNIEIPTKSAISQIIRIPTVDENLPSMALKYNDLIGQDLLINYTTIDNNTFNVDDENGIISLK